MKYVNIWKYMMPLIYILGILQSHSADPVNAAAAEPAPIMEADEAAPNPMIDLVKRLQKRGILSDDEGTILIKSVEDHEARIAAEVAKGAAASQSDAIDINYIPETVREQMREEIKEEVLAQAREENWADPRKLPNWVTNIKFSGDVRTRYEQIAFPGANNVAAISDNWNFNSINGGSPYDATSVTDEPPYYNSDQERDRLRLRIRLGIEANIGSGFTSGIRFASGDSSSPVSPNQTLGGGNGNFSKYSAWFDRGFIKFEPVSESDRSLTLITGRFDNPLFGTSMIWDNDLGFDGFAIKGKFEVTEGVTPFGTLGVFPVYNTDLNFASDNPEKFKSRDKWLYAMQAGTNWKISKDWNLKVAGAYYDFQGISGRVSDPYTPQTSQDAGNTDNTRPLFAQRGNTYVTLRNITPDATNGFGTTNQWQYYGLATPFREVALTGQLDYNGFAPVNIWLVAEYVKNIAFDRERILANGSPQPGYTGPVNNNSLDTGEYQGGDSGYIVTLNVGKPSLEKLWDWNVNLGYRYVESDATVDGFADSDFGGGGTNLKGYTLGGNLAFSTNVWLSLNWMSATSIAGPTYKQDTFQIDVNAKF